jgi:hypothetical protein
MLVERDGPDDVLVFHLLEKRDLANGSRRYTLILCLQADLLESDDIARMRVLGC